MRLDLVERLGRAEVFGPLDVHLARTLAALDPVAPAEVLLAGAFASRAIAHGHVCADLRRIAARRLVGEDGQPLADVELPSLFTWVMALGQGVAVVGDGSSPTPLVFDGGARVYLYRYFQYQQRLARALATRAASLVEIDAGFARQRLAELFAPTPDFLPDERQREAAAVAALRRFTVVSGGPGTGKTTTVARLLALLQEIALHDHATPLRITLLAPTGKAAARLGDSIASQIARLPCSDHVKRTLPTTASTIHRALGYRPGSPTRFRHDAEMPLLCDLVLVDEASMVDLAVMAKLVDALPAPARLVLVGDKDQLASVEAGAILGDICNASAEYSSGRSPAFASILSSLLPVPVASADKPQSSIADAVVELTVNHRFGATSGIGSLARAIRDGRSDVAICVLDERGTSHDGDVVSRRLTDPSDLPHVLAEFVCEGFAAYARARDPAERLARLADFRVLSPFRRGPFGVPRLNALIERLLADAGLMAVGDPFYDGRPILVTSNDRQLDLWNGDVGVLQRRSDGRVRAVFQAPGGGLRHLAPTRLPAIETVWAMTVHKSQGSEFERTAFIVPPQISSILTRELLYTAITRARRQAIVLGSTRDITEAIARRIDRASGLREALWSSPSI